MKKKLLATLGLIGLASLFLVACSSQSSSSSTKTKITVATDSDTAPFTYKKDGEFAGYDIDVLKKIFEDSDEYELSFVTTAFDSILTGVDADRYQIAANDFNYNAERAEKYLFSDPISKSNYAITSKEGTSYDSLDQLSGKKTEVISGSNYAQVLEEWNKANPDKDPIQINYASSSTGLTTRVQHIENGSIDFILYDAISSQYIVKDQGFNLTVTALKTSVGSDKDGLEYLLFADTEDGKELQSFVNKRIKELKEDGSLAKLSEEYFGGDFVSSLD
ncbi:transporter substrate-binding domain-containing protein [Streptococcus loxodontisalivarius]|uniref:Polar amino acid transport system substrate-binding protein n=1 Tax=Streptococcus loxodontisalivarius TaxID=1349415 RepID=A0ABS2PR31_9STRE|nr:transporter substrate-binding domain-containing protein [Streptococcus loxodontisalivarius]MBM7642398.1 polar amino acid transport system substrate-binding protein [Streptococcus loxodontisalivarius]